jgi:hypothetical protein
LKAPSQYLFGRANEADILPLVAPTPLHNPLVAIIGYRPITGPNILI